MASFPEEYAFVERKVLNLSIRFPPHWKRVFEIVSKSVEALDKTRTDVQMLLRGDETDANARKLRTFDKESGESTFKTSKTPCKAVPVEVLPFVIASMKDYSKSAANLDSRRKSRDNSRESPALRSALGLRSRQGSRSRDKGPQSLSPHRRRMWRPRPARRGRRRAVSPIGAYSMLGG
jgi:hypothetical protein